MKFLDMGLCSVKMKQWNKIMAFKNIFLFPLVIKTLMTVYCRDTGTLKFIWAASLYQLWVNEEFGGFVAFVGPKKSSENITLGSGSFVIFCYFSLNQPWNSFVVAALVCVEKCNKAAFRKSDAETSLKSVTWTHLPGVSVHTGSQAASQTASVRCKTSCRPSRWDRTVFIWAVWRQTVKTAWLRRWAEEGNSGKSYFMSSEQKTAALSAVTPALRTNYKRQKCYWSAVLEVFFSLKHGGKSVNSDG